jgi:uncharacterized membrane protein YidH (DUF202 family)
MIAVAAACTSAVQGYTTAGERVNCASLPHTGLTVIGVVLIGVGLLLLGIAITRIVRIAAR